MDQLRKFYSYIILNVRRTFLSKGNPVHLTDTFRVSAEFVFGLPVILLQSLVQVSLQKFAQKTVGRVSVEKSPLVQTQAQPRNPTYNQCELTTLQKKVDQGNIIAL